MELIKSMAYTHTAYECKENAVNYFYKRVATLLTSVSY